jgi:hypothetical protein
MNPQDTTTEPVTPEQNLPVENPTLASSPAPTAAPPQSKFRKLGRRKSLLIAIAAVVVLAGGSAAAYFGVVVPNRPANLLKSALLNTLHEKQASFTGKISLGEASGGLAGKAEIAGSEDSTAKAADVTFNVTVSGVNSSVQVRLVDHNVYVKLGDLSSLTGLAAGFSPDLAPMVNGVASTLSNKWIVIDSTLLKQGGVDCVLDTSWSLTDADVKLLTDQYQQHPFATISSVTSDTIDGHKVKKFQLSLDDDKLAVYGTHLKGLSLLNNLNKCDNGADTDKTSSLADHDKTPLTLWVDSSKHIVRIAVQSTSQDAAKSNITGDVTINLTYEPVSIKAPANATSVLQVISQVEQALGAGDGGGAGLGNLFQSFGGSSSL